MRWDVLNKIGKHIGAESNLEIGCSDGACLSRIQIKKKWGVDPCPHWEAAKHCELFMSNRSEEFFKVFVGTSQKFDLVFIDSDHRAEVAYSEVESVLGLLSPNGVVVLHDSNPTTREMQIVPPIQGEWTGDVWKAIARLRREGDHQVLTVKTDYGCAIVRPFKGTGARKQIPTDELLTWEYLDANREEALGLITTQAFAGLFPEK
jgi:hypothetical protein